MFSDSTDVLSAPLGQTMKIWLLFPPTDHNLSLMKQAEGQRAKLARIGPQLEGGMVFRTDSTQALYLPIGTLHAVITTQGGFLISFEFSTPTSAKASASMINHGLDDEIGRTTFYDTAYQERIWDRFLMSIDIGLSSHAVARSTALAAWVSSSERITEWSLRKPAWAKNALRVWKDFFEYVPLLRINNERCPCGKAEGKALGEHFLMAHIAELPTSGPKKRKAVDETRRNSKRQKR